jgi:hypothetical protein
MRWMTNSPRLATLPILLALVTGCWRSGKPSEQPLVVTERVRCLRQQPPPTPDPTVFSTLSQADENAMLWALLEQRDAWIAAAWAKCRVTP